MAILQETASQPSSVKPIDVLIVDDEEPVRRLLGRLLEQNGYICTLAADAREARSQLQENEFALILCDVNMPDESVLVLVKYVLAQNANTAVFMVTGLDDPHTAQAALELSALVNILIPFQYNEVLIFLADRIAF